MGILPDNKLRSSIWIIVSLLYFSIVSCSRFGLPDFFSAKLENQTSGEIANADVPNGQEELNNKNDEKPDELGQKQKTGIPEELSAQKKMQRREELLRLKEIEVQAKLEKLEVQSNQFNSYQKEINRNLKKREQSLYLREKEINERVKVVEGTIKDGSSIKEDTFQAGEFSRTIAVDKILFNRLPIERFIRYHDQIVLDGGNNLLWSRQNYHQEHKTFPESSGDCLEWADQWRREEYGGINGWRVPSHMELNQLKGLYIYVMGGDSENFKYWGIEKEKNSNLTLFEFSHTNVSENKTSQVSANCRLVANPNSR